MALVITGALAGVFFITAVFGWWFARRYYRRWKTLVGQTTEAIELTRKKMLDIQEECDKLASYTNQLKMDTNQLKIERDSLAEALVYYEAAAKHLAGKAREPSN
jgi:hypothetical protein